MVTPILKTNGYLVDKYKFTKHLKINLCHCDLHVEINTYFICDYSKPLVNLGLSTFRIILNKSLKTCYPNPETNCQLISLKHVYLTLV